jgi:hypothetical protein
LSSVHNIPLILHNINLMLLDAMKIWGNPMNAMFHCLPSA